MEMKQVYIAGKYTASTPEENLLNISKAMQAGEKILEARGWWPIVPHCSMNHETDWPVAMNRCADTIKSLVPGRDCIVMLPEWEDSIGASREWDLALDHGIEILTYEEALR